MGHYRYIPDVSSWAQSSNTETLETLKDKWGHTEDLTTSCCFDTVTATGLLYPYTHSFMYTGSAQHTLLFVTQFTPNTRNFRM